MTVYCIWFRMVQSFIGDVFGPRELLSAILLSMGEKKLQEPQWLMASAAKSGTRLSTPIRGGFFCSIS